jgi:lysozyme family protein
VADFQTAAGLILTEEGVYSNLASDGGGETKFGVARNRHPEITDAQWAAWTPADSLALFRSGYWDANRCGEMPWPFALCLFDADVNQGDVKAADLLQQALGLVVDGKIGAVSLARIATATNDDLAHFMALRALAYAGLGNFSTFGHGWFNRLFIVHGQAILGQATALVG